MATATTTSPNEFETDGRAAAGWTVEFISCGDRERWLAMQHRLGVPDPDAAEVRTRVVASSRGVRCDWNVPHLGGDRFGLLLANGRPPVLIDREQGYTVLATPAAAAETAWTATPTGRRRLSRFGEAEELVLAPRGESSTSGRLSVWWMARPDPGTWLTPLWRIVLPPVAGLPAGLPLELHLEEPSGEIDAVLRLTTLRSLRIDPDAFVLPTDAVPTRSAPPLRRASARREADASEARTASVPAAPVFATQPQQEKAKLHLHSTVIDQCAAAANQVLGLVGRVHGEGLTLQTSAIYDNIAANAPSDGQTRPSDRIIPNLLNRVLLGWLATKLRAMLVPEGLRRAVTAALAAAPDGDVLGVVPPADIDAATGETFELIKRYAVALGANVDELRALWAEGNPDQHTGVVWAGRLIEPMTERRQQAMRTLFDVRLGEFTLRPKPPLRREDGRARGWFGDTYMYDELARLVDVRLSIDAIDIELGDGPILGPMTPVTAASDVVVALLDLADTRQRVGLGTVLAVDEVAVMAHASTRPASTYVAVELAIVCPPCFAALWQDAHGRVAMSGVRAAARALFANDSLGLDDTRFELRIFPPTAATVDVDALLAGVQWLAFPMLTGLAHLLADIIVDDVGPSILAELTSRFGVTTRMPGLAVRLQPWLNLDRESYRERLERVLDGAPDPALDAATAAQRLDELVHHTPSGRNTAGVRSEFIAYSLWLAITEPGPGGALSYPPDRDARVPGELTLVLSHGTLQYFLAWAGSGIGYQGDIRRVETPDGALGDHDVVDFWTHAPEPQRLGTRPPYQVGPPQAALTPGTTPANWVGYSALARVTSGITRILPVSNPAPDAAIAELGITVEFDVRATTFAPVSFEVCEDLTRVADWLDRGFGPPQDPFDPGDPVPPWADGITRIRRTGPGLSADVRPALGPDVLDTLARLVDDPRPADGPSGDGALRPLFARPAAGVFNTGRLGHTVACHVVTSWDIVDTQQWLTARVTMTVPVAVGIGELFVTRPRFLPLLSYRFDPDRLAIGPLEASAPEGPLGGLLEGANRDWLGDLLVNHALSLLRGDNAGYRKDHPARSPLRYAYGTQTGVLEPEGFAARLFLALHGTHWKDDPDTGPGLADPPPTIDVETFGTDADRLNVAFNLHLVTNLFDRIAGP